MLKRLGVAVALSVMMGQGGAALHDRGGGMIYDDILNITWLADANQGAGSSFDNGGGPSDGRMTWANAMAWADALVYGGYSDWRLPTALNQDGTGPCYGPGCTGSELGHMFSNNMANLALFTNVQFDPYWSGTEYAPNTAANGAWHFGYVGSSQYFSHKDSEAFAWAVRDGDVARVPVPGTLALLGLGLGVMGIGYARGRPWILHSVDSTL